jgi:hypothetical protein
LQAVDAERNEEMWGAFPFPTFSLCHCQLACLHIHSFSLFSWASGALDPEGAASHSSVTSIKRYGRSSQAFTITTFFFPSEKKLLKSLVTFNFKICNEYVRKKQAISSLSPFLLFSF